MRRMHPARRARKLIAECEQIIRDAEAWNALNPSEQPLDCEPERVTIAKLSAVLEEIERGDWAAAKRASVDLEGYAQRVLREE